MFNVNLITLIRWFLPFRMRGTVTIAFIKALATSLQKQYNTLDLFRTQKQYELSITSQVIWLEKMLNGIFDPINTGIYIEDVGPVTQVYVNNKAESPRPRYIYNKAENAYATYIRNKSESVYPYNFTVMVPYIIYQGLLTNNYSGLKAMKANLNKYKMFGTVYQIQSY